MTTITLSDGRALDVVVSGAGSGPVLLFHHGTPGSVVPFRAMARATESLGMRLVTYSRAGAGSSTRKSGRSIADVADDMAQVLDHVGADRCVTAGWSGGGPHALATAALLPDRVTGVTSIAGIAPYDAEGLDFLTGMGQDNIEEFGATLEGEDPLRGLLEGMRPQLKDADAAGVVTELSGLLPDVDKALLTDEFGEDMSANIREALRIGVDGWLDDDLAFVRPWGFDLDSIAVPVFVWQGDADLMVPFSHGRWLAEHLPGASAHLLPGEGHLSVGVGDVDTMFGELRATL